MANEATKSIYAWWFRRVRTSNFFEIFPGELWTILHRYHIVSVCWLVEARPLCHLRKLTFNLYFSKLGLFEKYHCYQHHSKHHSYWIVHFENFLSTHCFLLQMKLDLWNLRDYPLQSCLVFSLSKLYLEHSLNRIIFIKTNSKCFLK